MEELRKFRQSLGLTTTEISQKMQISKSLYEKVELGFRKPSRNFIEKVKKIYPQFDTNIFFT